MNARPASELPTRERVPVFLPFGTEGIMQVELHCPSCACRFGAAPETPFDEVLDRMVDEGPWFGLAEGDTFADMISAALSARGVIRCPDCLEAVAVRGPALARPAREPLACC